MIKSLKRKLYANFKEPSDVYSAIRPLFIICTLFGLAPYTLVQAGGQKRFQFGWASLLRNLALVLTLLGTVAYNALIQRTPFRQSDIQQKLRYCQEVFSSLLSCWAVIFGCIFASKICEVFQGIDEADGEFKKLAIWVPYKGLYVRIILHVSALVLVTCLLIVNFAFVILSSGSEIYWFFITFMTIFLPYFINLLMELQYGHYLNILRIRYRLLNEYLETLVDETKKLNGLDAEWSEESINPTPPESVENRKLFTFSNKIPKSMLAISDPIFVVDQVAALHIKLTDIAHLINYAFCAQQLLRITVAFISIVTALFLVAINFSSASSRRQDEETAQLDYFFTAWAFSNACEVMAIVWITSETCEEANNCPRILHKIRNNTYNTNLQDTIEIYSLQMYHNRLNFTVCGLFPLDYTLLYTIVAGVTTYLVILIQFNNSDFIKQTDNGTLIDLLNATIAPSV